MENKLRTPYPIRDGDRIVTSIGGYSCFNKSSQGWVLRVISIRVDEELEKIVYEAKELETYHVYLIDAYDVDWELTGKLNGFENLIHF